MPKIHIAFLSAFLLVSSLATAQTTYRWVDKATGQTVYSDQPPPPGASKVIIVGAGQKDDQAQVPYATRQAAQKYPVTLFTAATCIDECKQARDFLNSRGIPFSEKMLSTQEERDELTRRLGSEAVVPSFAVGQESVRGFEPGAWTNLLDLAGYPKSAPYGARKSGAFAQ